ncbi:hypothetical protein MNEG_15215 [Monoraphidium neglectum]|uniref:glucose-1-phosphate adenylyltransferase n=1 Tax=Monoraphidium neglectum TaxID=145388 RepID=A0A0D2LLT4_9CHLO|nr:hypothetical protein MNEG_15215 [Monoraphidium neglectum]KIY92749.1 hypothetical protein MNEG_15215 [Monoraphidium neglectum]|eukprot:XP_013891769.1 hypothetical protein MNEG_15215 [Monoraphidium neglectum]
MRRNLFTTSHDGFVECLNATQRPGSVTLDAWYQGTADAVRRYLEQLTGDRHSDAEDVLILSGDQLQSSGQYPQLQPPVPAPSTFV